MNISKYISAQTTVSGDKLQELSKAQGYSSQIVNEREGKAIKLTQLTTDAYNDPDIGEEIEVTQRVPATSNVSDARTSNSNDDSSESANYYTEDEDDYPDGGLRAYTVLFGSFLGFTLDFGLMNSVGAVQSYLSTHQLKGTSSSLSALVFSLFVSVGYASSVFSGILFDEFGTKLPLISGSVLLFVGLFCTGECNSVISFIFVFGILTGSSLGFLLTPSGGVVAHYFKKNRARAFGIATFGGSFGGVVFPLVLDSLYKSVGFTWTMRILAFICLGIAILALVLMKERLKPHSSIQYSELPLGKRMRMSFKNVLSLSKKSIDFKALKDPKFVLCALSGALCETSLVCALTYFASYTVFIGYSSTFANTLLTILNALGIVGRYFPGLLADKIGPYNVMIVMIFGIATSTIGIWWGWCIQTKTKSSLYCFVVVYGFFNSSALSLTPACLSAISPTRDFGKRYATLSLIIGIFMLGGLTAGGAIIGTVETDESYRNFVIYCALLAFIGDLTWIVDRFFIVGAKFKVKV